MLEMCRDEDRGPFPSVDTQAAHRCHCNPASVPDRASLEQDPRNTLA